jgi:DNA helicase-2/ATP-dependent DNA helicase PcrA
VTLPLNPAQHAAVEHAGGPLLVLAGAGSGKTRVLTARIAHLIQARGTSPARIFAVTFTNKAASEMRARVAALLGSDPRGLWIGTFHSMSARILRREATLLGFGANFTIYDAEDSESFLKRMLEQRGLTAKAYPPRVIHSLISAAKNRLTPPEEFAQAADSPLLRVTADLYQALGPALRQANAMDFDDLLLHPLMLFAQYPERLDAWQRRFEHVLVDEFQDTNDAQYRLVKLLSAGHRNLCVVGDDDQSIYSWRGADVRHMLGFQRDFPGAAIVRLEQNYRSTQVILNAANAVIAENTGRLGKTLFTENPGADPVVVLAAADERDEAEWLVTEFSRLARETDVSCGGMAVLYRTNAQSRPLEEAFRFRGIPYRLIGAISFYERREVKDLLAFLRLIMNPADDEAFARVVNVPRRGLGDASLTALVRIAGAWGTPLLHTAGMADRVPELRQNIRDAFLGFASLMTRLREVVGQADPATALEHVIAVTGYDAYLADEGAEGVERLENVRELVAGAAEWAEVQEVVVPGSAATGNASSGDGPESGEETGSLIERYLTQAALLTPHDEAPEASEAVTLLTVHMAKGLEWRVVALAGLEDGLFPLARAVGEPGGLEEERRLCYVGLTRARERLYLSWARTRYRNGRLEMSQPSRFLAAVPDGVVDERSTTPFGGREWSRGGGEQRRVWERSAGPASASPFRASARPRARPLEEQVEFPEDVSQDAPRYQRGERVRHRRFGAGVVRAVQGSGRDLKVTVEFDDEEVGIKQLLVAYAALERDWESA